MSSSSSPNRELALLDVEPLVELVFQVMVGLVLSKQAGWEVEAETVWYEAVSAAVRTVCGLRVLCECESGG